MPTYFVYCRKSSEAEDRQVLSIDSQITELRRHADYRELAVAEILTETKSAKEPGRPIFNQMMQRLARGEASGIICWKLDRLARNPIDGGAIIWAIKQHGISIVTPHHTFSQQDDNAILMYLEFGMAQKYVDDLSRNVKRGLRTKAEQGWYPGPVPLGYLNEAHKQRGLKTVVKDPDRFPLVRKMWDLLLTGAHSVREIREIANNQWGFRTRLNKTERERPLCRSATYRVFTNPFYYGEFEYPAKSGVWYKGTHEPLITRDEYNKAQVILGRAGRPRPKRHIFAFTGLIHCETCGAMVTAEGKRKQQKNGNVHEYTYYHCTKRKMPSCPERCIETKVLTREILDGLAHISIPETILEWALKYVDSYRQDEERTNVVVEKSLRARTLKINEATAELIRMRSQRSIDSDEFERIHAAYRLEIHDLESQLKRPAHMRWVEPAKDVFNIAAYACREFETGDREKQRQILTTVSSNLFLHNKKIRLELKKPFVVIKNRRDQLVRDCGEFEPPKNGPESTENRAFAVCQSTLLRVVEDVRTAIITNLEEHDRCPT